MISRTFARLLVAPSLLLAIGCARGAAPVTAPTPAPASQGAAVARPSAQLSQAVGSRLRPAARSSAPPGWHRMDLEQDGVLGVGSERALRELLADKQPQRRVVVAIIDGGVDTSNILLKSNLWRNTKDTTIDGKDDDGNGYVDDGLGWNYSVKPDGESVQYDTFSNSLAFTAPAEDYLRVQGSIGRRVMIVQRSVAHLPARGRRSRQRWGRSVE